MGWIYTATNTINGKGYIGQTIRSIQERLEKHQQKSSNCRAFLGAIKKHGWENFHIDCYECPDNELNKHERWMVKLMGTLSPNGYNLMEGGGACGKRSEETKQKNREAQLGKKQSEETKQKISDSLKGENCYWYGKTHCDETKQRQREAHIGKKHSKEHIQHMSGENNHKSKRVYQYDLDGIFIDSFGSCGEAARHIKGKDVGRSNITMCARGKFKTAYKFKWSYTFPWI